jgi:hypothetical protein
MSDQPELLRCPHCGGEAKLEEAPPGSQWTAYRFAVYCQAQHCGATTALCSTESRAVEYWNRRVSAGAPEV